MFRIMRDYSTSQILSATAALSVSVVAVSAIVSAVAGNNGPVIPGRVKRLAQALFKNAGGHGSAAMHMPTVPAPELREVGAAGADGERQYMEKRLYMQVRILDLDLSKTEMKIFQDSLKNLISTHNMPAVLYADASSSNSLGLLSWSEDPSFFTDVVNAVLSDASVAPLFVERAGWTMFGKTYSNGHEKDLSEYLFKKPIRNATKEDWDWAIWYPLRRKGPFYVQPPADQCKMLLHHAAIGKAFSELNAAHDIRLKSFGIDGKDNEYIVGILGDDLHSLSRVVEEMRKTRHTAEFLESLGPFFVGKKIWTNLLPQ